MNASRPYPLVTLALLVGLLVASWCGAQPTRQLSERQGITDSYVSFHQLESFLAHLQETKQTETLRLFNDYSNVSIAQKSSVDIGHTLRLLAQLRAGHTNEIITL